MTIAPGVPADWEVKRLADLGRVVRGGSPRPAGDPRYFNGTFIPWLTVASLTTIPASQMRITVTEGHLTKEGSKRSRRLSPGTLVLANSGATLGVAKVLDVECCANDGIAALIDQHTGDSRFICQYLNTQTEYLREVVAPGNGQPNLNTSLIREIQVPFPPLWEQARVAEVLGNADHLITTINQLISKKRDVKLGMMQELLSGRSRLPGHTGTWTDCRLGDLGVLTKGRAIKRADVRPVGTPCIRYGELYTTYNDYTDATVSFVDSVVAASALPIRSGDVLFAASGETKAEIGMSVAYVGAHDAVAGGDIIVLRGAGFDPIFLSSLLNTPTVAAQKARGGQGDAVVHISSGVLANIRLQVPGQDEQRAIARVIRDLDAEIVALERRRDAAWAIKTGMTQELLAGRTRLPIEEDVA